MKDTAVASPSGGANTRTMVLLGILAVLIAATAYDFLYARPRAKQIHDEIFAFCDDTAAKKTPEGGKAKMYTPDDIHKMLGDKFNGGKEYLPSKETAVPGHMVETYSVMAGAVIRSHDVHVIYNAPKGNSKPTFYTVHQGEFPKGDLIPVAEDKVVDNTLPPPPTPGGTGGGGGGGAARRPGGATATIDPKKDEEKKDEPKKEEEKKEGEEKKEEPKADEPKPEEPKKEEPKADEPKKEEPKPEEPKKEEPKPEEPKKEEPKPEEPKKEEPKKEEPKADEPKKEEPKADEPKPEEPKKEEPKAEEPKKEEPKL